MERGLAVGDVCSTHKDAPVVKAFLTAHDERDGTIDACARIPARAFLDVLQVHLQQVVARLHIRCQVHAEGVIAVGPVACLVAVEPYGRFRHSTVEQQLGMFRSGRDGDGAAVVTFANPGQRPRASALLRGRRFAVLYDGHALQVPLLVEGPADGPVVRHADRLPLLLVARELPVVRQRYLLTRLRTSDCRCSQCAYDE